jgi:hypothetical protein
MLKSIPRIMLTTTATLGLAFGEEKPKDERLYELRTYHAEHGKLDRLLTRFRDHTFGLFEKHGMTNVGYWVPVENKGNLLIYLISHKDRTTRDESFKNFVEDPAWKTAAAKSEEDGKLVSNIDTVYLTSTDFSPGFQGRGADGAERLFEMRTYTTTEGNLEALKARFRDHTVALFEKHGITSLGYYTPAGDQPPNTLLYFLAHKDAEAAENSFAGFRADPEWVAARKDSEDKAGGSLTAPDGVKSVFLRPTDFSPVK